jgi:hypothetical protein
MEVVAGINKVGDNVLQLGGPIAYLLFMGFALVTLAAVYREWAFNRERKEYRKDILNAFDRCETLANSVVTVNVKLAATLESLSKEVEFLGRGGRNG